MEDSFVAPIWVLTNLLLALTAWRWSRYLFPRDPLLLALGHSIVISWACIVTVAFLLGMIRCLAGLSLVLGVAAVAGIAFTKVPAKHRSLAPVEKGGKVWVALWCLQLSFWIGHVLSHGLSKLPMNWDSLDYHLPLVDHWLQAKSLYAPDCGHWTNPGNNEVLALWATGAFSGDFWASLNNIGPTILFACSVVGLGTQLGMQPVMANLTGFIAVGNFVVFSQLTSNENDVAVAACFFAAASYGLPQKFCYSVGLFRRIITDVCQMWHVAQLLR